MLSDIRMTHVARDVVPTTIMLFMLGKVHVCVLHCMTKHNFCYSFVMHHEVDSHNHNTKFPHFGETLPDRGENTTL